MSELKKSYTDVRLIRNEKSFDIFSFDKSRDGAKFEPDFILLLEDKEGCYHRLKKSLKRWFIRETKKYK
ncbi:MAG: Unknown protein [uncultured Sulfurovum sp.]|uniref:Uncharacterized protein n=1 Tax=uncultured Sulfurovum sp. TaxID=269237 RepID=A0A6S6T9R0_9BACT|nr:MAG: Unknown protein [uncultured Sulfurovum sp.]